MTRDPVQEADALASEARAYQAEAVASVDVSGTQGWRVEADWYSVAIDGELDAQVAFRSRAAAERYVARWHPDCDVAVIAPLAPSPREVTEAMVERAIAYDASTWPSNPPEWSEKAKADGRAYYRGLLAAALADAPREVTDDDVAQHWEIEVGQYGFPRYADIGEHTRPLFLARLRAFTAALGGQQ